jgi:ligand-binding SRPBCC domain-containing protein
MKEFTLHDGLWVPALREEVFPFFADAGNLEIITPPWLKFKIVGKPPVEMTVGVTINYRLRVHGFPLKWQSEITAWEPPHRFVDEQRIGPYRRWIHEHRFEERDGGTLCIDQVRYAVLGGRWIERLFVRKDVAAIFKFRREKLRQLFSK